MNTIPENKRHERAIQSFKETYFLEDDDIESEVRELDGFTVVNIRIPEHNYDFRWTESLDGSWHSWFRTEDFDMDEFLSRIQEDVAERCPRLVERQKCYSKLKGEIFELQKEVSRLQERNSALEEENTHLRYSPGGEGAMEAQAHFDFLANVRT
ncbi:hypothetical protein ISTM_433 [Insectomime virus]|nr:hypothetical protein ISTM_433 [Insectomime virus]